MEQPQVEEFRSHHEDSAVDRSSPHGVYGTEINADIEVPDLGDALVRRGQDVSKEEEQEGTTSDKLNLLAPSMKKTPTPTPTVFEWRTHLQQRLSHMDHEIEEIRSHGFRPTHSSSSSTPNAAPGIAWQKGAPAGALDQRSFRIAKEFEDQETAFQRNTTKIAIDVARAETERAVQKANQIQNLFVRMQERLETLEARYSEDMRQSQKVQQDMHTRLNNVTAESRILKEAVNFLQDESKVKDKQLKDMEEVIFYLQEEISKAHKTATDAQSESVAAKLVATRLEAANTAPAGAAGKGAARKSMPSPPPKAAPRK